MGNQNLRRRRNGTHPINHSNTVKAAQVRNPERNENFGPKSAQNLSPIQESFLKSIATVLTTTTTPRNVTAVCKDMDGWEEGSVKASNHGPTNALLLSHLAPTPLQCLEGRLPEDFATRQKRD